MKHNVLEGGTVIFKGAFAKLRNATNNVVVFVRLSVRMEQLVSHWTDFPETWFLSIFQNLPRKINFHYNVTRIIDPLHEDQHSFLITSSSIFPRMRNVSDKSCRKPPKIHILCSIFLENHAIYGIIWKTTAEPKQALQYKPKGWRHIGRPRKRWRDQFHFEDTKNRNQT